MVKTLFLFSIRPRAGRVPYVPSFGTWAGAGSIPATSTKKDLCKIDVLRECHARYAFSFSFVLPFVARNFITVPGPNCPASALTGVLYLALPNCRRYCYSTGDAIGFLRYNLGQI